ncbi:hypothetical protein SK128_014101 [Halocaridina rubra]|uniref:Uncharacterized protein n=1 Tax=Halocaridina rubra TaxID=373956 RepID=A0AAN8ZPS5_HALRR
MKACRAWSGMREARDLRDHLVLDAERRAARRRAQNTNDTEVGEVPSPSAIGDAGTSTSAVAFEGEEVEEEEEEKGEKDIPEKERGTETDVGTQGLEKSHISAAALPKSDSGTSSTSSSSSKSTKEQKDQENIARSRYHKEADRVPIEPPKNASKDEGEVIEDIQERSIRHPRPADDGIRTVSSKLKTVKKISDKSVPTKHTTGKPGSTVSDPCSLPSNSSVRKVKTGRPRPSSAQKAKKPPFDTKPIRFTVQERSGPSTSSASSTAFTRIPGEPYKTSLTPKCRGAKPSATQKSPFPPTAFQDRLLKQAPFQTHKGSVDSRSAIRPTSGNRSKLLSKVSHTATDKL